MSPFQPKAVHVVATKYTTKQKRIMLKKANISKETNTNLDSLAS